MRKHIGTWVLTIAMILTACSGDGNAISTEPTAGETLGMQGMTSAPLLISDDETTEETTEETTADTNVFTSSIEPLIVIDEFESGSDIPHEIFKVARQSFDEIFADGDSRFEVTRDLKLPSEKDGVKIKWISSDESLLDPDGKVTRPGDHSRFVLLTGEFDGEVLYKNSLRIARKTRYKIEDYNKVESEDDVDLWYWGTDSSFDSSRRGCHRDITYYALYGVNVETMEETKEFVDSLSSVTEIGKSEFRPRDIRWDTISMVFDLDQYFKDVKTAGYARVISFLNGREYVDLISDIIVIPDDFDVIPKVGSDEITERYDLKGAPELMIDEYEGKPVLVWSFYKDYKVVTVSADTGDELFSYDTFIVG